jgi:hypothetical protein
MLKSLKWRSVASVLVRDGGVASRRESERANLLMATSRLLCVSE